MLRIFSSRAPLPAKERWPSGSLWERGGARSRWNLRNLLVIGQIAVSLMLLIGSGLFLKAFRQAQSIDPGFRTANLGLLTVDLNLAGYDAARSEQAVRTILEQVARNP